MGHLNFLTKMPELLESNAEAHQGEIREVPFQIENVIKDHNRR